jgi:magnesium transporter
MDRNIESVSRYLASSVPTAGPADTVGAALAALPGRTFDAVDAIYVLDGSRHLLGTVTLAEACAAPQDSRLDALMQEAPATVRSDTDREEAASIAIREEIAAVPVVDADGRFLGVFPARAIMHVLRQEHLEDLHHMAGISHRTEEAREALQGSAFRRVRYRLPWLMVGLVGSLIATSIVAGFETTLQAHIAVAFFVPAIVYLADAVGTQSEAVAVRGLSLTSMSIGRLLAGEMFTGMIMGTGMAALAGLFALVAFGDPGLALAVAIALACACSVATGIGLTLPWAFARTGWDPALASGPVATVIQDMLSLLIYFAAVIVLV